jgi:hypothetical protein
MSVYYNVKEHISTNNFQDETITSAIIDTLVSIGREMLYDRAIIRELSLQANGNEYFFKGSEITPKLHEIIRVINSATTMDLVMSYDSVNSEFPIAKKVSEIFKKGPCYANNLFYSLYNKADCNSGVGLLSAYGEKNGKFYCGPVELQNSLWVEGEWYNEDSLVAFEGSVADVLNLEDLKKCVAELSALGADVDFRVDKEEISLFVNNMTIKTSDTFACFMDLCMDIDRLTNGNSSFMLEFADTSDADARVMMIELDNSGEYVVSIVAVS